MQRRHKWLVAAMALLGLLGAAWLALAWLVPSNEELALRAAAELERRLGVPVSVGALHWRLLPSPAVVLENMATGQPQAITVKRLAAELNLAALGNRRLKLDRVEVEGAVVPQLSLRGLGKQPRERPDPADADAVAVPLERLVFHDVTWISRLGIAVVYDGDVDFDAHWRPRQASLRRPGLQPVAELAWTRQGLQDRWTTRIVVGGGTAHGEVWLKEAAAGQPPLQLQGRLQPRGIEVASALAAFNRRSIISGRASGDTVLWAHGRDVGEMAQSLHTRTAFRMSPATLLRFDLDKAMRTLGKDHAGQTRLDDVAGQLDTQNTPQGMVSDYTRLKAHAGKLTASGKARIANRHVDADLTVDLVEGVVGVPLRVNGPYGKLKVSVPPGAIAGAVVGTAVLPGVGTVIGARIGATVGQALERKPARKAGGVRQKTRQNPRQKAGQRSREPDHRR